MLLLNPNSINSHSIYHHARFAWRYQERKISFYPLSWDPQPTNSVQFSTVQSLSRVWLFVTPWIAARQDSLSITNSRSPPKPMSIELVMPSNHLILCRPLLLLPSIFPSIRVFSNESALRIRWPKYWRVPIKHDRDDNIPISFHVNNIPRLYAF